MIAYNIPDALQIVKLSYDLDKMESPPHFTEPKAQRDEVTCLRPCSYSKVELLFKFSGNFDSKTQVLFKEASDEKKFRHGVKRVQ